ncbi:MAG: hypothetical protein ACW987_20525 [Candidatus Thorarchaeota archaeon]|jgi:hypothetical protein
MSDDIENIRKELEEVRKLKDELRKEVAAVRREKKKLDGIEPLEPPGPQDHPEWQESNLSNHPNPHV